MKKKNFVLGLVIGVLFCMQPVPVKATLCGDADGDGVIKIQDIIISIEYLFNAGIPPADLDVADFDGRQIFTISDVQGLWNCFFNCTFANPGGSCPPTLPALAPPIDPSIELRYVSSISPGVTSVDVPLTIVGAPDFSAFTAPLSITLDGAPAIIDSVTVPAPGSVFDNGTGLGFYSVDGPGVVRIGIVDAASRSGAFDVPVILHLSVPMSINVTSLGLDWTVLSPAQAPTADSSVYPLFHTFVGDDGFVPALTAQCCIVAGDANNDGAFNIADVTFLIERIFRGGDAPICDQAADVNGDGFSNIADVTYGIAHIFTGGAAPICGP